MLTQSRILLKRGLRNAPKVGVPSTLSGATFTTPRGYPVLAVSGHLPIYRPQTSVISFSTQSGDSSSSGGGIRGWMQNRTERKQQEEYMAQMTRLSEMDRLTLENYKAELERGLNKFGANISFLQTKEVKTAKDVVIVIKALIDVKGSEATADDLSTMDRLERLKVATSTNKTVEEISILLSQIHNMDLMQRVLRKRKLEGKPIPPDPTSMQAAIKKDAVSVMSKTQKEMMMKRQVSQAQRAMRKKR